VRNSRIGRTAASLLAACVLLSACGGDDPEPPKQKSDGASGHVVTDSTASHVSIQMTGLLLIVPPAAAGGAVQVYLPHPREVGLHAPLLGFAIPLGDTVRPGLCDNRQTRADPKTICYVNLSRWKLQPFGAGGTLMTRPHAELQTASGSSGLLDVTHLSGRRFRAFATPAEERSVSKITLLSGQVADGLSCKLAEWRYRRVYPIGIPVLTAGRDSLANVVEWQMPNLRSPVLVFVDSTGRDTARIALPPGNTRLLLAHIPEEERIHLPPNEADSTKTSPHAHFGPFYDLLSRSASGTPIAHDNHVRRRIPAQAKGRRIPCPLTLRTGEHLIGGHGSMATYACMPALGQGGT
jgi:hypothetical protein